MKCSDSTAWRFHQVRLGDHNFHSQAVEICLQIMKTSPKDIALMHSLLPNKYKADTAVLYAWCRRIYDMTDQLPDHEKSEAIERFEHELEAIYSKNISVIITENKVLIAFRELVRRRRIPKYYTQEFLEGIKMDILGTTYPNVYILYKYCFRVSSILGLMFCHIVGVRDPRALSHIAHMGIAIHLTKICNSVRNHWKRDRLYLPMDMLKAQNSNVTLNDCCDSEMDFTSPSDTLISNYTSVTDSMNWESDQTFTELNVPTLFLQTSQTVIPTLQTLAELHYDQGVIGLKYLPWRASLTIDAMSKVYQSMGRSITKDQLMTNRAKKKIKHIFLWRIVLSSALIGGCKYLFSSRLSRLHRFPVQIPMYMLLFEHLMRDIQSKEADELNHSIKKTWTSYFDEAK